MSVSSSMATPSSISGLLSRVKAYPEPSKPRITTDVVGLLQQINSLQAQIAEFVFPDGRITSLLQLHGTIPTYYKGNTYHTPVELWITENYPNVPPTVYVRPTRDMRIKHRHKHVDAAGMVYLPYLNQWSPRSTLAELTSFMSSVFSEDPPCYKAPAEPVFPMATPNMTPSPLPVATPPKPATPAVMNHPYGSPAATPSNGIYTPTPVMSPPMVHAPVAMPVVTQPPPAKVTPPIDTRGAKKTELTNEVTSKLQAALHQTHYTTAQQIDHLFETQRVLGEAQEKLDRGAAAITNEHKTTRAAIDAVDSKIDELKAWLDENENKADIDAEVAIQFKDSWSKQLFEQVALDHAIEDTFYVLDKALSEDRLDLPTFLKEIRKLARKQFFARALSLRIYEKQQEAQRAALLASPTAASSSSSSSSSAAAANGNGGLGGMAGANGVLMLGGAPSAASSAMGANAAALPPIHGPFKPSGLTLPQYRDPGAAGL